MIHVVLYLASEDKIKNILVQKGYPVWEMQDSCLVACQKTAQELSAELEIGNKDHQGNGVVLSVNNYSGFASKDLVEWIKVHG